MNNFLFSLFNLVSTINYQSSLKSAFKPAVVLAFLSALCFCNKIDSPQQAVISYGNISGTVTDDSSAAPIPGVTVLIGLIDAPGLSGGGLHYDTTFTRSTDANGAFLFSHITAGVTWEVNIPTVPNGYSYPVQAGAYHLFPDSTLVINFKLLKY